MPINNLKISVCIATYNGESYIREQVDSILSQLKDGDELIVSDDGSTDGTVSILSEYSTVLKVISCKKAGGVVANFERALNAASGDVIFLCDQDDVWISGRVDFMVKLLANHSLVMTNGYVVDGKMSPLGMDIFEFVRFRSGFINTLISTKYVGCCMAFRRNLIEIALPFPRNILWHDWYIALVGLLFFKCTHSKVKTIFYRRHSNNASQTGGASSRNFFDHIKIRFWILRALFIAIIRFYKLKLVRKKN